MCYVNTFDVCAVGHLDRKCTSVNAWSSFIERSKALTLMLSRRPKRHCHYKHQNGRTYLSIYYQSIYLHLYCITFLLRYVYVYMYLYIYMDFKHFTPIKKNILLALAQVALGHRTDSWNFFSDEKRPCAASLYSWTRDAMAIRTSGLRCIKWYKAYVCINIIFSYLYI